MKKYTKEIKVNFKSEQLEELERGIELMGKQIENLKCCGNCIYHGEKCYNLDSKYLHTSTNENDVCDSWANDNIVKEERMI